MEDKVVYRIISNIAVLENNDRVENIAVFKENLDDEKCNPNSPHFLVDNIPEDNLIAKISINLENGLLIPDNTKKDGRYTFIEIKDMVNASQLAYQKAKYKREDYGRTYRAQILSIALDYHNILSEDGKTINLPRFIPFSVRNASANKEADKVKNMVNWVKECLKNCKQGETLFFPWLAYGHAGMVAINSLEYNKDQPGVYLRYFEMGGMYLCDDGIITDSGNFNGIEKFGDKSRINDCFGEFASHIEGYTENIPVPVCFDIIKNKSGPYGQRASETDCSYRSEAAYIFYINGTIKSFDDFKIILNNEENLKLIKDTIYGVKRRALIRLNDNNRYKNIFYYNAGSGNYTKDLALLPKISIEYNDYKGYPDNPWAQIPQTNSNEQNSQIFGNNFTDAKLKLFSQIQDKNDQLDTITLKLSEDGKKLLKNIDIIKITPKKLTKEEGLSQLDLIKNIEQSGFTKEILENNNITIKRKNVEHFEPLRNFLLKNINKNLVGYNKGYSKEV